MGAVLRELEDALRSKGDMSFSEERLLGMCKEMAVRHFFLASGGLAAALYFATKRLNIKPALRFNGAVGFALIGGNWAFNMTLRSCVEAFLGCEGDRIQMELARIILTKHGDDTTMVEHVRKHFYPEQVFNDLNQDKPLARWRPRFNYADSALLQRLNEETEDSDSDGMSESITRQTSGPIGDLMADPLECIVGSSEGNRDVIVDTSDNTGTPSKKELRVQRRAHRHRRHHAQHAENAV